MVLSVGVVTSRIEDCKKQINITSGTTTIMHWSYTRSKASANTIDCSFTENNKSTHILSASFNDEPKILSDGERIFGDRINGTLSKNPKNDQMTLSITIKKTKYQDHSKYICKYMNYEACNQLNVLTTVHLTESFNENINVISNKTDVEMTLCGNPKPKLQLYFRGQASEPVTKSQSNDCYLFSQVFDTPSQDLCGKKIMYNATGYKSKIGGYLRLNFSLWPDAPDAPRETTVYKTWNDCFQLTWFNPDIGFCTGPIISQVKVVAKGKIVNELYNTSSNTISICPKKVDEIYKFHVRNVINGKTSDWNEGKYTENATSNDINLIIITCATIGIAATILLGILWFRWRKLKQRKLTLHDKTNCHNLKYSSLEGKDHINNEIKKPLINPVDTDNNTGINPRQPENSIPQNHTTSLRTEYYERMAPALNETPVKLNPSEEHDNTVDYEKLHRNQNDGKRSPYLNQADYDTLNRTKGTAISDMVAGQNSNISPARPPLISSIFYSTESKLEESAADQQDWLSDDNSSRDSYYASIPADSEPMNHNYESTIPPDLPIKPSQQSSAVSSKTPPLPRPKSKTTGSTPNDKPESLYDIIPRRNTNTEEKPLPPIVQTTKPLWQKENTVHGKVHQPHFRKIILDRTAMKLPDKKLTLSSQSFHNGSTTDLDRIRKQKRTYTDPSSNYINKSGIERNKKSENSVPLTNNDSELYTVPGMNNISGNQDSINGGIKNDLKDGDISQNGSIDLGDNSECQYSTPTLPLRLSCDFDHVLYDTIDAKLVDEMYENAADIIGC